MGGQPHSSREINTHYIITTLFNPLFNKFINRYISAKAAKTVGARVDIEGRSDPFYSLAVRLEVWRSDMARKGKISEPEFESEIRKLVAIYRDAERLRKNTLSAEEILNLDELLQSFPNFLTVVDNLLGTNFKTYVTAAGETRPAERVIVRVEEPRSGPLKCSYCGEPIEGLPFTCSYCGRIFCVHHHLPENHECSMLPWIRRPRVEGMFKLPYPTRRLWTAQREEKEREEAAYAPVKVEQRSTRRTPGRQVRARRARAPRQAPKQRTPGRQVPLKHLLATAAALAVIALLLLMGPGGPPPTSVPSLSESTTVGLAVDESSPAVAAALRELNEARRALGLPSLTFTKLRVSEYRVKYMYDHKLFSHYDAQGVHPTYYFTLLDGGAVGFEENVLYSYCIGGKCITDVTSLAAKGVRTMIYDDAHSSWGHRDSLLDPCNNKVSIAAAWGGERFYMAVHMVSDWVEWVSPPSYRDGVFSMKGYVRLPPTSDGFYPIYIYRDTPSPSYVSRHSYDHGSLYAGVLPQSDYYYLRVRTIYASRYILRNTGTSWYLEVEFPLPASESGVYTIVVVSGNVGVKWEPKSPFGSARKDVCRIVTYSFRK